MRNVDKDKKSYKLNENYIQHSSNIIEKYPNQIQVLTYKIINVGIIDNIEVKR